MLAWPKKCPPSVHPFGRSRSNAEAVNRGNGSLAAGSLHHAIDDPCGALKLALSILVRQNRRALECPCVRLTTKIATLWVRHAVSNRFVMLGADGVGFRAASRQARSFFQATRCSETDNAITPVNATTGAVGMTGRTTATGQARHRCRRVRLRLCRA